MDRQAAQELVPSDPWKASARELIRGAHAQFEQSLLLGKAEGLRTYNIELGRMLIAVLQAKTLTRATWALAGVTAALVVTTVVLVVVTASG